MVEEAYPHDEQDLNFIRALAAFGEALDAFGKVMTVQEEILPYAELYPTKVEMKFEGEPVGAFVFHDDFWWWAPL